MSLVIRDEKDKIVDELNPIVTEHNGTTGDTVILPFMLENDSQHHFHRDIAVQVSSKPPVDISLNLPTAPNPIAYSQRIEIRRLNPKEKRLFNLKTVVLQGTQEQEVTGTTLQVTSLRFPMHQTNKSMGVKA